MYNVIVTTYAMEYKLKQALKRNGVEPETKTLPYHTFYGLPWESYPTEELAKKRSEELMKQGKRVFLCIHDNKDGKEVEGRVIEEDPQMDELWKGYHGR